MDALFLINVTFDLACMRRLIRTDVEVHDALPSAGSDEPDAAHLDTGE